MKNRILILIILGIIIILGIAAGIYFSSQKNKINKGDIACTEEAKICTDGSAVGRSGPNCEFSKCPEEKIGSEEYRIEKVTGESCKKDKECETPGEYLIRSSCPFTSKCLDNKCTVICPKF